MKTEKLPAETKKKPTKEERQQIKLEKELAKKEQQLAKKEERERIKLEKYLAKQEQQQARKEERERIKLERELAKIDQQLAKIEKKERIELKKQEQQHARYQDRRRYLPDVYPEWEHAENADPSMILDGYVRVRDCHLFEQVKSALQSSTFNKVLDSLSDVLECDKSQICLFEKRKISRNGEKIFVISFRYTYNPEFNEELRGTDQAKFDARTKAWNLTFDQSANDIISKSIGDFYRIVIDLNEMVIMRNENEPAMASETILAFKEIPYHISVRKDDILTAIAEFRANDFTLESNLYINDGRSGFGAYPDQGVIWTRSPFLLLRYSVSTGRPRYVSYSTLGMVVEEITFGNDTKKTSMAIARFMDSCRVLRMSAFETDCAKRISEEASYKRQLQGGFDRFTKSINQAKSSIPDLGFAPLCSDYVTLLSQKHGADSEGANIVAYIAPGEKACHYFSEIALYFGYKSSDYPVVFTRSFLDAWDDEQDCDFLSTLAHELAHWLVFEIDPEYPHHGVEWAVCQDLLEYVYQEEYSISEYCRYHLPMGATYLGEGMPIDLLDDKERIIQNNIEDVVSEVGIEKIRAIRSMRPLSKDDIKRVTHNCLLRLASYSTKDNECRLRDQSAKKEIEAPELPLAEEIDLCTGGDDKAKELGFEETINRSFVWSEEAFIQDIEEIENGIGASQEDAGQISQNIATHRTPWNVYAPNLPLPKKEQGDAVQLGLAKLIDDGF